MAETLYERAMRMLGKPITKAVDPDDADSRVDDKSEPTDKKLDEAGEEAAAGGQAGGDMGGEQPGGVPEDPGGEAGDESAHSEPDGDEGKGGEGDGDGDEGGEGSEEGQDMDPDEIKELRKAFGLTDFDKVDDTKKSSDISGMLGQILAHMQKQDAFMQSLTKELADLKAKHASGKPDEDMKITMKSFTDSIDNKIQVLQDLLANAPKTAPAAAQPKGFAKAVDTGASPEPRLTLTEVTKLAMEGKITAAETARLTRQINHNTPAVAGN